MTYRAKPGGQGSSRGFFSHSAVRREGRTSRCPPHPGFGAGPWVAGSCTDSRASFTVAGELRQAQVLLPERMGMAEKTENEKSPSELSVLVGWAGGHWDEQSPKPGAATRISQIAAVEILAQPC